MSLRPPRLNDPPALARKIQRAVELIEPWGVIVAIFAAIFALYEFRMERGLREATLFVMATERIEAARAADRAKRRDAPGAFIGPTARVGQIEVLEAIVRSDISLHNIDLTEINLRGARLSRADLRDADLTCAVLVQVTLNKAKLIDATPQGVKFYETELVDADFTNAGLAQSRFVDADLRGADFRSAKLHGTHFRDVELDGSNFTSAVFQDTRFRGADLTFVKGITQEQLAGACGDDVTLPRDMTLEPCDTEERRYIGICEARFRNTSARELPP